MSTANERKDAQGRAQRWATPLTGVVLGLVYLAIFLAKHEVGMAVGGLVIMLAYSAFLVLTSGRFEASALLRGETTDERRRAIDQMAACATLRLLSVVLVGGYLVSLVRGTNETTWASMCAVLGATYIVTTVYYSRRA